MQVSLSRRRFQCFFAVATASTTGCLGVFEETTVPDLVLFNETDENIAVTTTVTAVSGDRVVLSETSTISSDDTRRYENPIRAEETYLIRVSIENGPANRHEWDAPADEAYGLEIGLRADEIRFTPVAA